MYFRREALNVYDFDNTIYNGDSSVDFWLYCMKKNPYIVIILPYQVIMAFLYKCKLIDKIRFKEAFFCFLKKLPKTEEIVISFWDCKEKNIKSWYRKQQKADDLIISASPYFLLKDICKRIGVKNLIATDVDIKTGKFQSANCYGEEKVKRFYNSYPNEKIEEFYSDSKSDEYMALISERAFLVEGIKLHPWKKTRSNI